MALRRSVAGWLAAYALVALTNLASALLGPAELFGITLFLAMPTLIAALLAARAVSLQVRLVVAALAFSWLGDGIGSLSETILIKIVLFLAAQVCYAIAFWPFRAASVLYRPRWGLVYALVVGALLAVVVPAAGALAPAVVIYGCSLGLMAVLATGVHRLTALGAASFLVSDSLIALTTFVAPGGFPGAVPLIMATYLTGQLLIVLGIVFAAPPPRR